MFIFSCVNTSQLYVLTLNFLEPTGRRTFVAIAFDTLYIEPALTKMFKNNTISVAAKLKQCYEVYFMMISFKYQSRNLLSSLQVSQSLLTLPNGIKSNTVQISDALKRSMLVGNINPNFYTTSTSSTFNNNRIEDQSNISSGSNSVLVAVVKNTGMEDIEQVYEKTNSNLTLNEEDLNKSSGIVTLKKPSIIDDCRKRKIMVGKEKLNLSQAQKKQKESKSDIEDDEMSDFGLKDLFSLKEENFKKKNTKNRPNFFLSIRVNCKKIHKKVLEIHNHIQNKNKILKHSFVSVPTLHLTLFVMNLKDSNEKQTAIDALNLSTGEIFSILQKYDNRIIQFKGLDTFGGQVVYIDAEDDLSDNNAIKFVEELVEALKSSFQELNIDIKHEKFVPHVTIMKTGKCRKVFKKSGIKRIPEKHYEKYKQVKFGSQEVTCIELCSMNDKKDSDGYYKVLAKINLGNEVVMEIPNSKDNFSSVDLSSYNIIPHNFNEQQSSDDQQSFQQFDTSWHYLTDGEICESQTNEISQKDNKD